MSFFHGNLTNWILSIKIYICLKSFRKIFSKIQRQPKQTRANTLLPEEHPESSQTSKMKLFAKIVIIC